MELGFGCVWRETLEEAVAKRWMKMHHSSPGILPSKIDGEACHGAISCCVS